MPQSSAGHRRFAIGVDYGTNSVRAIVVDLADGGETGSCVYDYPSGEAGVLLDPKDPHLARQNPADYIEGLYSALGGAVRAAKRQRGFRPEYVVGIGSIDAQHQGLFAIGRELYAAMSDGSGKGGVGRPWSARPAHLDALRPRATPHPRISRTGRLKTC